MALHVVFGTGPIGAWAARILLQEGKSVRIVNRSGKVPALVIQFFGESRENAALEKNLSVRAVDASVAEQADSAAEGADIVYNCAHVAYNRFGDLLIPLSDNIREAARKSGAVLAHIQNLYMYARGTDTIDETTRIDPPSKKGKVIQAIQERLEAASDLRWTVVRASDYYGPGATNQSFLGTQLLLAPLLSGKKPMLLGDPDQVHSVTYVEDFARALVVAAQDARAYGKVWIVPNDRPQATSREILEIFFSLSGFRPGFKRISKPMLRLAGLFDAQIAEIPEMLYQKEERYFVDGSLFRKTFGFEPTNLEEGIARTIAWYRTTLAKEPARSPVGTL